MVVKAVVAMMGVMLALVANGGVMLSLGLGCSAAVWC